MPYLFEFATVVMSLALVLQLVGVARGIARWDAAAENRAVRQASLTMQGTIVLVLLAVLVTLSFVHVESKVDYERYYFLLDVVIVFLLVASGESIGHTTLGADAEDSGLRRGLLLLMASFACLMVRDVAAVVVQAIPLPAVGSVMIFHAAGMFLAYWASTGSDGAPLLPARLFLGGALLYFVVFWAFGVEVQLKVSSNS